MKVYIRENSPVARLAAWKLESQNMAITLGHTIHLHGVSTAGFLDNKKWVCHELAHVKQFERYGFLPFLLKYAWESLRKGYRNNRWEVEARAAEEDRSLLENVAFL